MPGLIKFNAIKPKAFRSDAFADALRGAVMDIAQKIDADFHKTTRSWATRVDFDKTLVNSSWEISCLVQTTNDVYAWVNYGTQGHPIDPVRAPFLRYQMNYRAKTSPGNIGSSAGGKFGPWAKRSHVEHPGTDPRNFDIAIKQHIEPLFVAAVKAAMDKGRSNSGHAI